MLTSKSAGTVTVSVVIEGVTLSARRTVTFADPCAPNPCEHAGICEAVSATSFQCTCDDAYIGDMCEVEVDACHPNPCAHDGQCALMDDGASFRCTCDDAYVGERCQTPNLCHPNPCEHDGECTLTEDATSFSCVCEPGYVGNTCEYPDPCEPNPCENVGICEAQADGSFQCDCSSPYGNPYHGELCEICGHACSEDVDKYDYAFYKCLVSGNGMSDIDYCTSTMKCYGEIFITTYGVGLVTGPVPQECQ